MIRKSTQLQHAFIGHAGQRFAVFRIDWLYRCSISYRIVSYRVVAKLGRLVVG